MGEEFEGDVYMSSMSDLGSVLVKQTCEIVLPLSELKVFANAETVCQQDCDFRQWLHISEP